MQHDVGTSLVPAPEGWSLRPLKELCTIVSGGTPSKANAAYWHGEIPWVSGKDLKKPELEDVVDHISAEGLASGSRLAPAGSVFVLVRGMGLAKRLPIAVALRPMAFNQDIKALIPRGSIPGAYIRAAIYNARARLLSRIVPSAHGTMTLNLDDIENFQIPVPDEVPESWGIVGVLNSAMSAISIADAEVRTAESLRRSVSQTLFTRGLNGESQKETAMGPIPISWDFVTLGSLGRIGNGSTPKRSIPAYWANGSYPWLNSGKVYDREISIAEQFVTDEALRGCHLPNRMLKNYRMRAK